jgi:hypothetical protein
MDNQDIHMFVYFHQYQIVPSSMVLDIDRSQLLNYMKQECHIHWHRLMYSSLIYRHYLYYEHFRIFVFYLLEIFIFSFICFNSSEHHTSDWIPSTTSTFIRTWYISAKGVGISCTNWRIHTFIDVNTRSIYRLNNQFNHLLLYSHKGKDLPNLITSITNTNIASNGIATCWTICITNSWISSTFIRIYTTK